MVRKVCNGQESMQWSGKYAVCNGQESMQWSGKYAMVRKGSNDQEMEQLERKSHTKNRGGKN